MENTDNSDNSDILGKALSMRSREWVVVVVSECDELAGFHIDSLANPARYVHDDNAAITLVRELEEERLCAIILTPERYRWRLLRPHETREQPREKFPRRGRAFKPKRKKAHPDDG